MENLKTSLDALLFCSSFVVYETSHPSFQTDVLDGLQFGYVPDHMSRYQCPTYENEKDYFGPTLRRLLKIDTKQGHCEVALITAQLKYSNFKMRKATPDEIEKIRNAFNSKKYIFDYNFVPSEFEKN